MKKGERWSKRFRILMRKIMNKESYKQKHSKAAKKRWKNPDENWMENFKNSLKSRENRIKHELIGRSLWNAERKLQNKKWWTKNRRKNWGLKMRNELTPEDRIRISEKMKERYRNKPYLRIKLSREKQEYYEKNPEARRNLLEYFSAGKRSIKAKGVVVKSEGEKIINDYLFDEGINPNYEAVELNFPEMDPTPDFFPEGKCEYGKIKNIFVEFYGGFPGTRTRNIRKSRLYKKYKIPVLIITPYELRLWNFRDYLLKELVKLSNSRRAKNFKIDRWELKRK